eukprot:TRINITY_DN1212_c0_g1_i1.p1 TRINITY_DN1212_c0_g1~~TRINITY_DN1212_c0_g1_i1.p1  ORF type:complete len:170 (-),score=42.13 TRINITY_DN1212_c0_g1_i1:57-566(-)
MFRSLCLVPNQSCWVVYIDAVVLGSSGNLFDSISMAMRCALYDTKIPKVTVLQGDTPGDFELELSEDPEETISIPLLHVPICVSLSMIGEHFIIDPSLEEESCIGTRLSFAVNQAGNICAIQKGFGSVTPKQLKGMLKTAQILGRIIIEKLDSALELESEYQEKVGFFS